MSMFNVSVKAKLYSTLALSAVILVCVGAVGLTGTRSSNADLDAIFSNRFMPTGWVGSIESHEREVLTMAEDLVIRQDAAAIRESLDKLKTHESEVRSLLGKLQATELTSKERQVADNFARHGSHHEGDRLPGPRWRQWWLGLSPYGQWEVRYQCYDY